jgi:hypothetical protein
MKKKAPTLIPGTTVSTSFVLREWNNEPADLPAEERARWRNSGLMIEATGGQREKDG